MDNKQRAFLVAERAHRNQVYDIYPYIYHIQCVVNIAEHLGYGEDVVVAAILHDVLEDTEISYNDIKKSFGEDVAEIVYCVTDELGRNRNERKLKTYPKIQKNWKATAVKICDRIANINHSMKYNKKMFDLYKKEHKLFQLHLMDPKYKHKKTDRAWSEYNMIMDDAINKI